MTAQRARRRAAHCGAVTASGTRIGQHGDVGDGPLAHLRAETVAAEAPTKARDQASWLALGGNPSSSAGSADIDVRSSSASRLSQWMNWLTAGLSVAPAAFAGAAASLLYGIGYSLVKRYMSDLPPAASAASTLGCSALLLAPLAWTHWPAAPVPALAWAWACACAGLAFLMYYRLIQRIGTARVSTVTYLVPVFGALLSWSILGEPLTWSMLLAGVLILGSVAFSQRAG